MSPRTYTIYDEGASFVDASGSGHLELSSQSHRSDAYTIARVVLDRIGLARGKAIAIRSFLGPIGTVPIDVLPPFDGPWHLRARGKWIFYGSKRAFIVFAIVQCRSNLPFTDLTVNGGVEYSKVTPKSDQPGNEPEARSRRRAVTPQSDLWVTSGDPGFRALPRNLPTLDNDLRYPRVEIHHTFTAKQRLQKSRDGGKWNDVPTAIVAVNVSDTPARKGGAAGVFVQSIVDTSELEEGRDFLELFQEMLNVFDAVAIERGHTCRTTKQIIDFSDVFIGRAPAWTSLDRTRTEYREIHLAEIQLNGRFATVIDIQRRPGTREEYRTLIACVSNFEQLGEARLASLLGRFPINHGHLREVAHVKLLQDVRIDGIYHLTKDTPTRFAERLLTKMLALLEGTAPHRRSG